MNVTRSCFTQFGNRTGGLVGDLCLGQPFLGQKNLTGSIRTLPAKDESSASPQRILKEAIVSSSHFSKDSHRVTLSLRGRRRILHVVYTSVPVRGPVHNVPAVVRVQCLFIPVSLPRQNSPLEKDKPFSYIDAASLAYFEMVGTLAELCGGWQPDSHSGLKLGARCEEEMSELAPCLLPVLCPATMKVPLCLSVGLVLSSRPPGSEGRALKPNPGPSNRILGASPSAAGCRSEDPVTSGST